MHHADGCTAPLPRLVDKVELSFMLAFSKSGKITNMLNRGHEHPCVTAYDLINHFALLSSIGISSQHYSKFVNQLKNGGLPSSVPDGVKVHEELAEAYIKYEGYKDMACVMDDNDSILKSIETLSSSTARRDKALQLFSEGESKYNHVVVDDLQSLTFAQAKLLASLARHTSASFTLAGAPSQFSPKMKWLGVDVKSVWKSYFPQAVTTHLETNYVLSNSRSSHIRSVSQALFADTATDIATKSTGSGGTPLCPTAEEHLNSLTFTKYRTSLDEAHSIAQSILTKLGQVDEYSYCTSTADRHHSLLQFSDIAVVTRQVKDAEYIANVLQSYHIPTRRVPDTILFRRSEILPITNMLKVLSRPLDNQSVYKMIYESTRYTTPNVLLEYLLAYSGARELRLIDVIAEFTSSEGAGFHPLPPISCSENIVNVQDHLKLFLQDIETMSAKRDEGASAVSLIGDYLKLTGKAEEYRYPTTLEANVEALNVDKLISIINKLEVYQRRKATLESTVKYFELLEVYFKTQYLSVDHTHSGVGGASESAAVQVISMPYVDDFYKVMYVAGGTREKLPTANRQPKFPLPLKFMEQFVTMAEDVTAADGAVYNTDGTVHTPVSKEQHIRREKTMFLSTLSRCTEEIHFSFAEKYGNNKRKSNASHFFNLLFGDDVVEKIACAAINDRSTDGLSLASDADSSASTADVKSLYSGEVSAVVDTQHLLSFLSQRDYTGRVEGDEVLLLSYSTVSSYNICPRRYFYNKVLMLHADKALPLMYGSAMHTAVEKYCLEKLSNTTSPSPLNLNEVLMEAFKTSFTPCEKEFDVEQIENLRQRGREGLEAWEKRYIDDDLSNKMEKIMVEKYFEVSYPEAKIVFRGIWDRVEETDGGAIVVDYKSNPTSKVRTTTWAKTYRDQLSFYALAYLKLNGKLPREVALECIETGYTYSFAPNIEEVEAVEKKLLQVAKEIRGGNFQTKPSSMACKHCTYQRACPNAHVY
jgi:putative RecB family exonuclease